MLTLMLTKYILFLFCNLPCLAEVDPQRVVHPGDIVIGGLFPIHNLIDNSLNKTATRTCNVAFDVQELVDSQVMIYAIEQINNSSLLPNVTIGYEIYDTCGDVTMALKGTLQLMDQYVHDDMKTLKCTASGNSTVKAVVGEQASEVSLAVSRLLTLPLMPQVSYASTSDLLSSEYKFPSFFRTVPSDKHQTEAIVQIVKKFNFAPVGIIGSQDEYGQNGAESLQDLFTRNNICVEFKEILPANFLLDNNTQQDIHKKLRSWKSEAIVLFTQSSFVEIILKETIVLGINRTWIASDAWATSNQQLNLVTIPGRIIGVTCKRKVVPGFVEYMDQFLDQNSTGPSNFFQKILSKYPFCQTDTQDCAKFSSDPIKQNCISKKCLKEFIEQSESYEPYTVYLAVNVIAQALANVLQNADPDFSLRTLTEELKHMNFSIDSSTNVTFMSESGFIGYDVLEWKGGTNNISTIGEYGQNDIHLNNDSQMHSEMVTQFNCYKRCNPGYKLIPGDSPTTCCMTCSVENIQEYQEYLKWTSGFSIVLATFAGIGLLLTFLVAVLFTVHWNTPVVRAAGGYLCFPALLALSGCFVSIFFFLDEPTDIFCRLGLPLFGLCFTACVSCILANLLQIFVGFSFKMNLGYWLKRANQPPCVVIACISIQVAVCAYWLVKYPPFRSSGKGVLGCDEGSTVCFVVMMVYIMILCVICFLFAYMGRRLPDLYKNGRFITVSMLTHLVVWTIFIPIYVQEMEKFERAIEATSILVSTYGILGCHFAPKCFILIWKKELNDENKIIEHIQEYYKKKEITFVT